MEIKFIKHIKRKQRIINENLSSKFKNDRRRFQKQVIDIDALNIQEVGKQSIKFKNITIVKRLLFTKLHGTEINPRQPNQKSGSSERRIDGKGKCYSITKCLNRNAEARYPRASGNK